MPLTRDSQNMSSAARARCPATSDLGIPQPDVRQVPSLVSGWGRLSLFLTAVARCLRFQPDTSGRNPPLTERREPLLDRYLRTNRNIAPEDRLVYENRRDHNVNGAFRVNALRGAGLTLY